jgi:hypothetical protein
MFHYYKGDAEHKGYDIYPREPNNSGYDEYEHGEFDSPHAAAHTLQLHHMFPTDHYSIFRRDVMQIRKYPPRILRTS